MIKTVTTTAVLAASLLSAESVESSTSTGQTYFNENELLVWEVDKAVNVDFKAFEDKPLIIESKLKMENSLSELKLLNTIHKFAEDQVDMDHDFKEALVSLAQKQSKRDFTRKRF